MRAPATGERWDARRLLALLAALSVATAVFMLYAGTAKAGEGHFLNVDGVTYHPTKIVGNGETLHYETPDTDPTKAFSDRHKWKGNGSEHLPCPNGIHWIDNKNVLTISNCLTGKTTTSSSSSSSSSSSTSSSAPTTSVPTTSSSSIGDTTTTVDEQTTTTPDVGDSTTTPGEGSTTTIPDDGSTTTPGDGSTTTTADEQTTTTAGDEQTTTTAGDEQTTTTAGDEQTTTTVDEEDPDDVLPTVVTTAPDEVDDEELPFTGIDSDLMAGLAVLLLGVGVAILAFTRRVEDN